MITALVPASAYAHARLIHARPAVGSTVSSSPAAVTLDFSEGVVPSLSSIAITGADGKPVAASRPAAAGAASLGVTIGRTLAAGTYTVTWHAVSVDTHRTQGRFSFTVAP